MLLPLAAFIGSTVFLAWQHYTLEPVRQETALFRETIETVTAHRSQATVQAEANAAAQGAGAKGKAAAETGRISRADIDLKELAKLMTNMRNGAVPDLKAMLKLQKTIVDLPPEELAALIVDVGKLDLPGEERDGLVMMLIQGLAENDPKTAVMAAADFLSTAPKSEINMISFTLRNAFSQWAKKDLNGALAWFDREVAAGRFENTSLTDVNQEQTQMIGGVLKQLWEKDPGAVRQRLLALSEKERNAVLTGTNGFEDNETSHKQFSALVRGIMPEKEQADALHQLAERVYSKHSLEGTTKFFNTIEATPEERKAMVAKVAESSIRQRTWGNSGTEKPDLENTTKLRTWLAGEDATVADTTLGKSLASTANNHGGFSAENAAALVTELHAAQPSDALLVSFLESSRREAKKETLRSLADKISDPAARAAALEKLAHP